MKKSKGLAILFAAVLLLLPAVCAAAVFGGRARAGVRVERDFSDENVTMEEIKALEEREREGSTGLACVAAWRQGPASLVREPVTGKEAEAAIIYVYGPVGLAFPGRYLCGSPEQAMGERDCVLTRELSWSLFGAVDTVGCEVDFSSGRYRVAAVMEGDHKGLFLASGEGNAAKAAFLFPKRGRIKEKMEALGFSMN